MSVKISKSKAVNGSVQLKPSNQCLQLAFTYQGQRRHISTGYSDTPRNLQVSQRKVAILEEDIEKERFDKHESLIKTLTPTY
ncbi:MAG: Arm DNA-binding domain-containing protein [Leptolyngbyaceae cyanobacterium]